MTANPYVKSLKAFDPKKDLLVNEKFTAGTGIETDPLSGLGGGETQEVSETAGRECCSFKTGGPITTDLLPVKDPTGKTMLIATNAAGQVILLSLEGNTLKPVWGIKVAGAIVKTPALAGGILYCATKEGSACAVHTRLQPSTGQKPEMLWQQKFPDSIMAEPIATGKLLIIPTIKGIYALEAYYQDDANKSIGKLLWKIPVKGIVSSPVLDSGYIYLGTEDKTFYALGYGGSKATVQWKFSANDAVRMKPFLSQRGNYVLAASRDGTLYCLNKFSGELIWTYVVRASVYGEIVSSVADNKELFYFGADNGDFNCVSSYGKTVWTFKTGGRIRSGAVIGGNTIYFGSEDNHLYALDAAQGTLRFKFATDGNIDSRPVLIDNLLFFGSTDSFVYGVYTR